MATSTLGSGTLVLAGTTSGTTTVTATAVAGTTTLTLPAATDTLVGKATTDTLTNKTLTTPSVSSPTISDGTANGVAYLNGSKVLTTGSALVFDGTRLGIGGTGSTEGMLTVGTSTVTDKNGIVLLRGAASSVAVTQVAIFNELNGISSGESLTLRSPAGFKFQNNDGSSEWMRLTSTSLYTASTINVGIGTSSPQTGLSLLKYGSQWTNHTSNTYPQPAGNTFLQMEAVAAQNNWFGFTGTYGATSGSANLLLQVNLNNTSQQAGNYIASEAQSATAADLTFGKMVAGATTGANSTKSEQMRLDSSGNLKQVPVTTASGALITSLSASGGTATVNSATYTVSMSASAKLFYVYLASGDAALVFTSYLSSSITFLGITPASIVASASPSASQFGISKSANSHDIVLKTGSALSSVAASWVMGSLSSVVA